MYGASHKLFAGAAFTVDQYCAAGNRDGANGLLQLLDRSAGADDVIE